LLKENKKAVYCEICRDFVNYEVKTVSLSSTLRTTSINYRGKEGYCKLCGNVVHVPELRDNNLYELVKRIKENK
jgi:hypothetical protein